MSYQTIEEYFTQFQDDVEEIHVNFISNHLPDLSRFYKIRKLFCHNNNLTCLPPLPSTLESLNCYYNHLTCLPPLPSTLKSLYCFHNKLTRLPPLPSTLESLYCSFNQLKCLPQLPSSLERLHCYTNQLKCLPQLPSSLEILDCSCNELTYLPQLPSTLEILKCNYNKLKCLPQLPSSLRNLDCSNNRFHNYIIKKNFISMSEFITEIRKQIQVENRFRELFYALKYKKQFRDLLWVRIREPKIRQRYHPDNLMKMLEERELTLDELDELNDNW